MGKVPIGDTGDEGDPSPKKSSWMDLARTIMYSATDSDAIHRLLQDLLSEDVYFRFDPDMTNAMYINENRPEKLEQFKKDARVFVEANEDSIQAACDVLTR